MCGETVSVNSLNTREILMSVINFTAYIELIHQDRMILSLTGLTDVSLNNVGISDSILY